MERVGGGGRKGDGEGRRGGRKGDGEGRRGGRRGHGRVGRVGGRGMEKVGGGGRALFSLSMFCYSLHSSTRQNIQFTASIVLFSDPLETTASIPLNKISITVNPWVFSYPLVLIAAHSWDNIPREFTGR